MDKIGMMVDNSETEQSDHLTMVDNSETEQSDHLTMVDMKNEDGVGA